VHIRVTEPRGMFHFHRDLSKRVKRLEDLMSPEVVIPPVGQRPPFRSINENSFELELEPLPVRPQTTFPVYGQEAADQARRLQEMLNEAGGTKHHAIVLPPSLKKKKKEKGKRKKKKNG
jgi:hypothetical protein